MNFSLTCTALVVVVAAANAAAPSKPTFYKDVLPVMQKNCQGCHRPGEVAPMSFMTYKEVRPYATAIRQSVSQRRMPPWTADPHYGVRFANDTSLSDDEIAILTNWAKTGATEGNPADAPAPVKFAEGWTFGEPDRVIEMPEAFKVAATGTIEYHYVILPTNFKEDMWVSAAEARPMNRAVNHHIIAFVREPGNKWFRNQAPGVPFIPSGKEGDGLGLADFLVGYAPGAIPERVRPGQAKLIKAGSDIVFQLHWTANGKEALDKAKLGLWFSKEKPTERVVTLAAINSKFEIPAGAENHQVDGAMTLHADTTLESLFPHMHVRGKSFVMKAQLPDGTVKELLNVPRYDFNWQMGYYLEEPIRLPKGSKILATGWFDNSANNKNNPDPTKVVRWGDQSWEEMMIGFFNISIPVDTNLRDVLRPQRKPQTAAPSSAGALDE
ncbi:MAG: cytochrome c [Bryobacter sp.]|nr:cytochrome c [Bryobacter sp.]